MLYVVALLKKLLKFENSNFLNRYILEYLKNSLNFNLKKRYTLTTSLWDWYHNFQNGLQIWNSRKKNNNHLIWETLYVGNNRNRIIW